MAGKAFKAGAEVDAYCTHCKMDLLHRIINMDGDKVGKVECRTCYGHHLYRRPKSSPAEQRAARASSAGSPAKRPAMGVRAMAAAQVERQREQTWERAVGGQAYNSFKPYRPALKFEEGELVRHAKFGDGYIMRVIDRQKVEVMFKDGPRTLAQALEG